MNGFFLFLPQKEGSTAPPFPSFLSSLPSEVEEEADPSIQGR
jgi:hypothetical protein